jgi:hypothetical protein
MSFVKVFMVAIYYQFNDNQWSNIIYVDNHRDIKRHIIDYLKIKLNSISTLNTIDYEIRQLYLNLNNSPNILYRDPKTSIDELNNYTFFDISTTFN